MGPKSYDFSYLRSARGMRNKIEERRAGGPPGAFRSLRIRYPRKAIGQKPEGDALLFKAYPLSEAVGTKVII